MAAYIVFETGHTAGPLMLYPVYRSVVHQEANSKFTDDRGWGTSEGAWGKKFRTTGGDERGGGGVVYEE